jgi:hypothetical protein
MNNEYYELIILHMELATEAGDMNVLIGKYAAHLSWALADADTARQVVIESLIDDIEVYKAKKQKQLN